MGKSQEGKQERNRRKQRGNAEEDRNLKRDRDLEKEKVESLYVTREMAEDKEMDEKIRQDLIHVADQAEKEFQEEEALGAPRMKPEEKQQLFDDIVGELKKKGIWEESPEDQLSAEDREALRLGRELLNNPKKKRSAVIHKIFKGVAGAAVVAVGVFVLSMSSEANRVRILGVWNSIVNDELRIEINNIDTETYVNQEQEAYDEIQKQLDIKLLRFMYIPEGMNYSSFKIDSKAGRVDIYYTYQDTIVSMCVYTNSLSASRNQQFDGEIVDSVNVKAEEVQTDICKINNENQESYMAEFNCKDMYYIIWGSLPEKEFKKIVEAMIY